MNPFLASALMLILRWLQFIATKDTLDVQTRAIHALALLDDNKRMGAALANRSLASHGMSEDVQPSDTVLGKKVM